MIDAIVISNPSLYMGEDIAAHGNLEDSSVSWMKSTASYLAIAIAITIPTFGKQN